MNKLAERTAVVTGAGGGIGGAIARLFAEEGARVACADVDADAAEAMIEAGAGNIVNVASQLGHVGFPGRSAYSATKGGTLSLTRVLALDHADQNIRVNSLSPGTIATQRGVEQYGSLERMRELRAPLHPIGRIGTVEEAARAALFLVSDDSSFMTGADLLIDGGYTAQ